MRYSESHKQETRAKVLEIAARTLRDKGPDKLGVAEVMSEAGLTHGGFYAHFASKEALLVEALLQIFANGRARFEKATEGLEPKDAVAAYVDSYVSARHRDNVLCPLVALNSDLPRQTEKFRSTFDDGVKRLTQKFAALMEDAGISEPQATATSTLSAMVGAVALSRAVSDRDYSNELLMSAREGIKARLGVSNAAQERH
jgi:TetR/AcrR family transcriptional repressor of nem operon